MTKISRSQFQYAYNLFKPGKYVFWVERYFGKIRKKSDLWFSRLLYELTILAFLAGFFGTVVNASHHFIGMATLIYCIFLIAMWGIVTVGVLLNGRAIRQMREYLELTRQEYDYYRKLYDDVIV